MRRFVFRCAVCWAAALAVVGLGLPGRANPTFAPTVAAASNASGQQQTGASQTDDTGQTVTQFRSNNWAGQVALDTAKTELFTAVSASWTVNAVTCNATTREWGVAWVGLDGWLDDVVEQGGTEAICRQDVPHYRAWWEMFPSNAIQRGFAVDPGDVIDAGVTFDPATQLFTIRVADKTSGKSLTETSPCLAAACPRTSAEAISEDVSHFSSGKLFPLPDYGTQRIKKVSITDFNGETGSLTDPAWQLGEITEDADGIIKQTTADPTANGATFSTTWTGE